MTDAKVLHRWRNDPLTRANSNTSDEVPLESHVKWLESVLADPNRELFICEVDGEPVGTFRIDEDHEISWTIAPEHRGKGLGKQLTAALPTDITLLARVKPSNLPTQKMLSSAGFERMSDEDGMQVWLRGPRW